MAQASDLDHDTRPVHFAHLVAPDGGVSPLCAARPRRLHLRRATWTNRPPAVTCSRCIKRLGVGGLARRAAS